MARCAVLLFLILSQTLEIWLELGSRLSLGSRDKTLDPTVDHSELPYQVVPLVCLTGRYPLVG